MAASSDVPIGPDSFDPTKLEFADDRIMGHTFATSGDGTTGAGGVTCAIDLRDDRSTPLLGAASWPEASDAAPVGCRAAGPVAGWRR